ncbi:hypothetical protein O5833_29105, partial [Escherichia coli]|nr:hypothetical protein [Escherichia coli]
IVEGANHMDLYDGKAYVAEAISVPPVRWSHW